MLKFVALFALLAVASAEIAHPCEDLSFSCIANYLVENAGCEAAPEREIGDLEYPYKIEAPFFKGTIDRYESTFSEIGDATVTEFFTDSEADRTVMSVKFPSTTNYGREILQYHTSSKLDTELDTAFTITYNNIVVTAQWQGSAFITIGTAKVYSDIESTEYDVQTNWPELAAEIAKNPDGVAAKTAQLAADKPNVLTGEEALYVGRAVGRLFWNNRLCSNLPKDPPSS